MKPFSLLVKPASADCNLKCRYCFYLEKAALYPGTSRHRMSDEVLEKMIRSYLATEQPQYAFGWQGGEPTLMGLDFFRKITDLQQRHARKGSVIANGLQTNGTLLDCSLAKHLADFRFLVGVSVDGPAEIHDANRVAVDGQGSHAAVMRGIECLKQAGVEFNILTLVSRTNVGDAVGIYRYLRDAGFLYHQYIECVEFDAAGRLQPYAIDGAAWGKFLCELFDAWYQADTRRVSIRLFDSILAMLVDGVANVCHMGKDCCQYLMVEHNGDVYPCDFYAVPGLKLGNVLNESWEQMLGSPAYKAFGARKRSWNERCEACEYQLLCGGDCQKNRPFEGRDPTELSPLCEGWKRFYGHTLERFRGLAEDIRAERGRRERLWGEGWGARQQPALNAPCPCGSGRKYKRCCGAGK